MIWLTFKTISTDLAERNLKEPEGMDVILFNCNQMETYVAEAKLKESEGIDSTLL